MRILYIHQYFNTPAMSGGTRSYEMARRFVANGHEVHMITSERIRGVSRRGWRTEQVEGVMVHWLAVPYDNSMPFWRRIGAFARFAVASARQCTRVGGDLVFATSTPLTIAVPAVYAKRRLKVPLVFEVRDLWPELPIAVGALRNPLAKWLARGLEKWAYRNSAHVVALSPGMAQGVVKTGYPAERVTVVPNSCDTSLFAVTGEEGQAFRTARAWLRDRPLILYAGTLGAVNGVSYLVDVAAELWRLRPEARVLVVGDGAERELMLSQARAVGVLNRAFFYEPPAPKSEMPALLNAATVCTSVVLPIPELESNSANKFFDSLAAGRPVAINYGGWQAELLKQYEAGLQLSRNPAEAAHALDELLNDRARLVALGENARQLGQRAFSRDMLAEQLLAVLVAVAGSSPAQLGSFPAQHPMSER